MCACVCVCSMKGHAMPRDLSSAQSGHINWDQVNSSPTQKPGINGSTADLLHLVDYCCVPIGLQKASLAPMIMLIACVKYLCVNSGTLWGYNVSLLLGLVG